jgi:hypothetical protein
MEEMKGLVGRVLAGMVDPGSPQNKLSQEWEKVAGKNIAAISRPFVSKKKILYVEVSDGGYAFEIRQKYQTSLLKRAQALIGEENILDIRIIVKP